MRPVVASPYPTQPVESDLMEVNKHFQLGMACNLNAKGDNLKVPKAKKPGAVAKVWV